MASTTQSNTINVGSRHSRSPSQPPPYTEHTEHERDIPLVDWAPSDSRSQTSLSGPSELPPASWTPTVQLQLQTEGKALHSLPTPTKPAPIPVFTITPEGHLDRPLYISLRPKRSSGSCYLVHGDDETETPLTTTTYRFGPGKPPVVRLAGPEGTAAADGEEIEINSLGLITRSQSMRTSLGTFQWRYGGAKEKTLYNADNMLILEHVTVVESGSVRTEQRTKVAQLARNEVYRTPGTCRSAAGNGGRLMMDLIAFDEKEREQMQILIVTTAIVMLKKEVDRRRRDGPYSLWWL